MDQARAVAWIQQVDGRLYHTPKRDDDKKAWVAVVRWPTPGDQRDKLIVALGGTMEEAAEAAERQWQTLWDGLSTLH
jgi:hypothetical protein